MTTCSRCDWKHDPEDQLAPRLQLVEHATSSSHPLCAVCSRSLTDHERRTCERCLTTSRETLAGITLMYDELPTHVGHVTGQRYDADRPSAADGRPLPGGEILVLLGKGSPGLSDDGVTSRTGDATSVAYELGYWANTWSEARQEQPAVDDLWPAKRQVRAAVGYLEVLTRWAAQQHPGFAQYVHDLEQLHGRLEHATGRGERIERAEAECFQCGADSLIRKVRDGEACRHRPPEFPPRVVDGQVLTTTERRARFAAAVTAYETAHGACQQGGHEDQWTCARCGATYDWQRYLFACRARVEDGRQHLRTVGWGTIRQVAAAVGTPIETMKTWAKRGTITTCCLIDTQEQLVWYPDADLRARRNRCRVEGHQPDPDPTVERTVCLRCDAVLRDHRSARRTG